MLPLEFVRNVDVKTREEEALLQEVVDRKLVQQPLVGAPIDLSSKTDQMTPEKEAELQGQIDAYNDGLREKLLLSLGELSSEEEPAEEVEEAPETLPEEVVLEPKKKKIKSAK